MYLYQDIRTSGHQDIRTSWLQDFSTSGHRDFRTSGQQDIRSSGVRTSGLQKFVYRYQFNWIYVHLHMYKRIPGFLELTDFGQFWQNQEISWENAVFLQEISWYLISCFLFSCQEMCHSKLNPISVDSTTLTSTKCNSSVRFTFILV